MGIRARLAIYGASVTGVAMLAFGILLGVLAGQSIPNEQENDLRTLAQQSAESITGLSADEIRAAVPLGPVDLAESTDTFVQILDLEGLVLYATGEIDGAPPPIPAFVIVEAGETGNSTAVLDPTSEVQLRIHATPWLGETGRLMGAVVAGQSTAFAQQQLAGLRAVLWVSGIITLIAAAVVAWLVSGRALKPLRDLANTTDSIGQTGDLSRRLPANPSRDEVGKLTTSFNAMLTELETSHARLATSLSEQRRFVADASHELRSPLTTIRNNAGFLVDRPDAAPADRVEAIADITTEAERMTRLVDDMLTLALADADAPAARAPVDLAVVLHDATRRAERAKLPITISAAHPAVVLGDDAALARLVWILIDNAAKHGRDDIEVSLANRNGCALFEVADKGPGIPPEHIDQVFDRFYRADPARSPAGAGLGLAIARQIVQSHGGVIRAENRTGGTAFTVELPLAR